MFLEMDLEHLTGKNAESKIMNSEPKVLMCAVSEVQRSISGIIVL